MITLCYNSSKKEAKRESIATELSAALERLDQKADEKKMHAFRSRRQREKEREHETQMQGMMLSFIQQMVSSFSGNSYFATAPLPTPHAQYFNYPASTIPFIPHNVNDSDNDN